MLDRLDIFLRAVGVFFILYLIGYSSFLFFSVLVGSSRLYRSFRQKRLKNTLPNDYHLPITVIVPAHNEEVTVVQTVRSLLSMEATSYEIIVVDDGSSDQTAQVLIDAFHLRQVYRPIQKRIPCRPETSVYETLAEKVPITLIRKESGGKADALNLGINASRFPYFLCMDADSVLQRDSLKKISEPILRYPDVVAVGGLVRIANDVELANGLVKKYRLPRSLLACMQVLEYDRTFLAARILMDKFNASLIISGAFGLFKKETVIAAGGYDSTILGEDMELVVKLHDYCTVNHLPYRIKYTTDAICWTQVPERLGDLCRQRRRWHIGLFQSMHKHRRLLCNPKYGAAGLVSYVYFLIYELLSPYIELFGILSMGLAFYADLINVPFMLMFFLIYAVFMAVLTLTAFFSRVYTADLKLSASDAIKAVLLCMLELISLRFVITWVRTTAFIGYRKKKRHWGHLARKKLDVR